MNSAWIVAVSVSVVVGMIGFVVFATTWWGLVNSPKVVVDIDTSEFTVDAHVAPENGAVVLINGTPVPEARYYGNLARFREWTTSIVVELGGWNYTLADLLPDVSTASYVIYSDGRVEKTTPEERQVLRLMEGLGVMILFSIMLLSWRPRPRPPWV